MFKYFSTFMHAVRNGLDVLILDEVHRIRKTSATRYTKASSRTGRAQIDELIAAARTPIFLLDENRWFGPANSALSTKSNPSQRTLVSRSIGSPWTITSDAAAASPVFGGSSDSSACCLAGPSSGTAMRTSPLMQRGAEPSTPRGDRVALSRRVGRAGQRAQVGSGGHGRHGADSLKGPGGRP